MFSLSNAMTVSNAAICVCKFVAHVAENSDVVLVLTHQVWRWTVRGKRQAVNRLTTTASAFVIIITDQQLHKICTLLSVMQYTTADTTHWLPNSEATNKNPVFSTHIADATGTVSKYFKRISVTCQDCTKLSNLLIKNHTTDTHLYW